MLLDTSTRVQDVDLSYMCSVHGPVRIWPCTIVCIYVNLTCAKEIDYLTSSAVEQDLVVVSAYS